MTLTANLIRVAPNMMEGVLTGHPVFGPAPGVGDGRARDWSVGR